MSLNEVQQGQAQSLNPNPTQKRTVFKRKNQIEPTRQSGYTTEEQQQLYQQYLIEQRKKGYEERQTRTFTREQFIRKLGVEQAKNIRSSIQQRQNLSMMKGRIKPDDQYVMQEAGPTWSKGQILTGRQIINLYDTVLKQGETASFSGIKDRGSLLQSAGAWHPETKIHISQKGEYTVDFPFAGAENWDYISHTEPVAKGLAGFFSPTDPLGLASSYYALTGDIKKAQLKRDESLGYFYGAQQAQTKGGIEAAKHFGMYLLESPIVQLGALPAIGLGGGMATSAARGWAAYSKGRMLTVNLATVGVGVGLAVPAVSQVYSDAMGGRPGEAFAGGYMLGSAVLVGGKAWKLGEGVISRRTGLTTYERFSGKQYEKHIMGRNDITMDVKRNVIQLQKDLSNVVGEHRLFLKKGGVIKQNPVRYSEVETLQNKAVATEFVQEATKGNKGIIQKGSAGSPPSVVPEIHDIDYMMTPRNKALFDYLYETRYGGEKPWDIHEMVPTGGSTGSGRLGGLRLEPYTTETGEKTISWVEWLDRLRVSSSELAKEGRIKDIQRLPGVLEELYKQRGFIKTTEKGVEYNFPNAEMQDRYLRIKSGLEQLYEEPVMMTPTEETYYFGPNIKEKLYDMQTKIYKDWVPDVLHEAKIKKIVDPTGIKQLENAKIKLFSKNLWENPEEAPLGSVTQKLTNERNEVNLLDIFLFNTLAKKQFYNPWQFEYQRNPIINIQKEFLHLAKTTPYGKQEGLTPYTGREIEWTNMRYLNEVLAHEMTHIRHPMWGEKVVEWYEMRGKHPLELQNWVLKTSGELVKIKEPEIPPVSTRGYYSSKYGGYIGTRTSRILSPSRYGGYKKSLSSIISSPSKSIKTNYKKLASYPSRPFKPSSVVLPPYSPSISPKSPGYSPQPYKKPSPSPSKSPSQYPSEYKQPYSTYYGLPMPGLYGRGRRGGWGRKREEEYRFRKAHIGLPFGPDEKAIQIQEVRL